MEGDRVDLLLGEAADRLVADVVVPPVATLKPSRAGRGAALASAAAVVVIAAGVALVGTGHQTSARVVPITSVGDPVPLDRQAAEPQFGDAPPPQTVLGRGLGGASRYSDDANGPCDDPVPTGELALPSGTGDGRLTVTWNPPAGRYLCRLMDGPPVLTLLDGDGNPIATSRYTTQPPVVNPPDPQPVRYVGARGLQAAFRWTGNCGHVPVRARLEGITPAPVDVAVSGAASICSAGDVTPVLGLLGGDGVVPPTRAGLDVRLEAPADARAGQIVTLVGRLANPTPTAISLEPCPTWLLQQQETFAKTGGTGTSGARTGRVPCGALPSAVAPGTALRFELQERLGAALPEVRGLHQVALGFGIAGAAPWTGAVTVDHGQPGAPVATVPWKATATPPGKAQQGAPPIGTKLPFSPLHPSIEDLPDQVRPGQVLRYRVRLTNMATGGDPVLLRPCPGFVQTLQFSGRVPDVEDEHYLNCEQAPAAIAPSDAIWLDMQLQIPADAPVGPAGLAWKLGKADFTGTESAMTQIQVARP